MVVPGSDKSHATRGRSAIVWAVAVAIALVAALAPPFAQPQSYHRFADQRSFLGIPNFLDVASNLAFLVVGALGVHFVIGAASNDRGPALKTPSERWAWGVAFAAVALGAFGSAYYHWAPDSSRLVWDRLPIAVACMSLVAAIAAERIGPRAGLILLVPLALLGASSVWYWRWSAAHGIENLNPYGAVQFGSGLVILAMIALFPARYTRSGDFLISAILYAAAKAAEYFDRLAFDATGGIVSGHTLKHLLAAAAVGCLLHMLNLRQPIEESVFAAKL
jgi:hypothetical protein